MQLIAITGSIASGKSTLRRRFAQSRIPTIDADDIAHALIKPGGAAYKAVAKSFPDAINSGEINRQKLGEIVFGDEKKLHQLEAILHHLIRQEIKRWARTMRRLGFKQAVVEVPLLFESGMNRDFDLVICTIASQPEIKRRAMLRPGMTKEKLKKILARQWPQARKARLADRVEYK